MYEYERVNCTVQEEKKQRTTAHSNRLKVEELRARFATRIASRHENNIVQEREVPRDARYCVPLVYKRENIVKKRRAQASAGDVLER